MLSIEFNYVTKYGAEQANHSINSALVGYKPFIEDEIIVTPIEQKVNHTWSFNLLLGNLDDSEVTSVLAVYPKILKSITITQ